MSKGEGSKLTLPLPPEDPLIPAVCISDLGLTAAWSALLLQLLDVLFGTWPRDLACLYPSDLSCAVDRYNELLHVADAESRSISCLADRVRVDGEELLREYDQSDAS